MNSEQLLERIMESDPNIRHSIVADADGNIETVNHREGVSRYLSEAETAESLRRAATAWKARKELTPKIGKGLYAVAAFENLVRITFPLGEKHLLFVSVGSGQTRNDLHQGGQTQIIEHVLNILDGDPTTA
jgi:hypothetical protein